MLRLSVVSGGVKIEFMVRGCAGSVQVTCVPNDDPRAYGCDLLVPGLGPEFYLDFPLCTATVDYDGQGYSAVFGWVQLVRSTDNSSAGLYFEADPIALYADLDTPFCWFGIKPTLFDAPFRFRDRPTAWRADSFLCVTPNAMLNRDVQALLGFRWGFDSLDDRIVVHPPERLTAAAWIEHLPQLRSQYPRWSFIEAFQQD
jgi:hypothetical protein